MSHGGAQWCHRVNTMDNLRTAVVKQLNRQKVTRVICDFINVFYYYLHDSAHWCHLANTMDT